MAAAGRFVGHSDDGYNIVTAFHQRLQARHGELRRTHIDDSQIFLRHSFSFPLYVVLRTLLTCLYT